MFKSLPFIFSNTKQVKMTTIDSQNFEILKKLECFEDSPLFFQKCTEALVSKTEPNLHKLKDFPYSKEDCELLQKALNNIYKHAATHGQIIFPENYPESLRNPIKKNFHIYYDQIENMIAKSHFLQLGTSLVESFDWKLKWILGTSKLATTKEPILQVDLRCASATNLSTETINFEAKLGQINELVSCLSSVQNELEILGK